MDFGDILRDWDTATAKPYGKKKLKADEKAGTGKNERSEPSKSASTSKKAPLSHAHPVDTWLRRYGVQDKDSSLEDSGETVSPSERRRKKHALKAEAVIDLHGLTRDDAWQRLESFFADCSRRGFQKVLIIHGKGTHSGNGSVLMSLVKQFIEQNPHAGESGFSDRESGGSGSTWVILK